MSKQGEKRPSIRFKGYTEPWEQRKATEIFYSVSDKNHIDLPVLSASQEYGMIKRNEIGIDIKYDKESIQTYKRVKPGQFVIHLRSFQGGFAHSLVEGITSPAYTVLDFSEENKHFDLFWREVFISKNFIKRLETVTYGIRDGRSISFTDFSSLNLQFPTLPEQRAIGSFFQELDQLITLQQRELKLIKEGKKTLLSKMFPKDGENFPEIRFPGFTDAWEQRKLGEVSNRVKGNDGRMDLPTLTISAGQGWLDQKERFSGNIAGKEQKNYTLLTRGELSYNHGNSKLAKYGAVFQLNDFEEALVPKVYHSFKMVDGNSGIFIEYLFSTKLPDKELRKLISSGARMDGLLNITYDDFVTISLTIPRNKGEQATIGSFFQELDQLITLQQRELEILKTMKSTLLKAMFA